jgi:hypothetical protein
MQGAAPSGNELPDQEQTKPEPAPGDERFGEPSYYLGWHAAAVVGDSQFDACGATPGADAYSERPATDASTGGVAEKLDKCVMKGQSRYRQYGHIARHIVLDAGSDGQQINFGESLVCGVGQGYRRERADIAANTSNLSGSPGNGVGSAGELGESVQNRTPIRIQAFALLFREQASQSL